MTNLIINNPLIRLKKILSPSDIKSLYIIFFILLLSGIFETAGIASIIPFINIISDPEYTINNEYILIIVNYLGLNLNESKVLIGMSVLFLFIFINLFNIYSLHKTLYFIANVDAKVSTKALNHYLRRPYGEFVESSPSSLTKHILEDASTLGSCIIYPLIQIISKSIIVILISILLIIIDYKVFISSFFILTIIYMIIYKKFTYIAKEAGDERVILNDQRYKTTRDVFNSLKEVKFYSLEKYYSKTFSEAASKFSSIDAKIDFLSTIPRYIIEIIMFGIIFSSIIYLIFTNSPLVVYLPLIAVFILAAYRAVPMLQNVYSNINQYKLYSPVFDIIENIFDDIKDLDKKIIPKSSQSIQLRDNIKFKNISFRYPSKNLLFEKLSFEIKAKKMTSIIGSTGSGKTTLVDLLLGFYKLYEGKILIDETLLTTHNQISFNKNIGYVPQIVNLQENSLAMNIALGIDRSMLNQQRLSEILEILDLTELVNSLHNGIDTNIGDRGVKLSGGQRQRLGIARALYLQPELLILDESTNELDSKTESKIFSAIRTHYPSITIIMITHRLSSLKLADRVILLKNNSIHDINMTNISDIDALETIIDSFS